MRGLNYRKVINYFTVVFSYFAIIVDKPYEFKAVTNVCACKNNNSSRCNAATVQIKQC